MEEILESFHLIWKVSEILDQQSIVSRLRDATGIHSELECFFSPQRILAFALFEEKKIPYGSLHLSRSA